MAQHPGAGAGRLCRSWADARGVRAVVVFDGRAPGGLIGEQDVTPRCLLVGTGAESADDWLVRAAGELRAAGQPFWLVTSDRELRTRAGEGTEKVLGGGSFARELTSGGAHGAAHGGADDDVPR